MYDHPPAVFLADSHVQKLILTLLKIYSFTRGEGHLSDAAQFEITQQKGFKWTIHVLRQFTHLMSRTIDAWETFKDGEIRYFNGVDSETLADAIRGRYLAAIDKDVTELRDLRSSLIHQTELFENMTNSVRKQSRPFSRHTA